MERLFETLEGGWATLAGGAFLAASFAFVTAGYSPVFDPAWITVAICGLPIFREAFEHIVERRKISSPFLIALAAVASIAIGEVFAAGEIVFIMAVGEILEDKTVERAKRGIAKLVSLVPAVARKVSGGSTLEVPAAELAVGDIVRVLAGETIPADGVIVSGETSVDQSLVSGESIPVDKKGGDTVYCGTTNRYGAFDFKVGGAGKNSSLEKLIALVREAGANKSPTERIADKWASYLVPAALAIAVAVYFITGDISRAVTVLVVFCPCALVLATPTSVMAAIGQAAKYGVIVKSGAALESMGKVDCAAFDKTGTLTRGKPSVCDIYTSDGFSSGEILALAASAESFSEHPLGAAICARAKSDGVELGNVADFSMSAGGGIRADVGGRAVVCGNLRWLAENKIGIPTEAGEVAAAFGADGKALVFVAVDGKFAGIFALSDEPREVSAAVVSELSADGVRTVLLTGDNRRAAEFFAKKCAIVKVFSELKPADKVARIEGLKSEGRIVCMVGDGVNDAPALKTADVGVAMASMGSDIAVDAADIALMGDDISKIPYLKRLANATVRSIKVNISLSMAINFVAVGLSVAGMLTPVSGALVHNLGSVLVVLNAGLLYDRNYLKK